MFCLKCGKSISVPTKSAAAADRPAVIDVPPADILKKRRQRRIIPWFLLATVFIATILWVATSRGPAAEQVQEFVGLKKDRTIIDAAFPVGARNFRSYKFSLPEGSADVSVVGQFVAAGDSQNPSSGKGKENGKGKEKDKDSDDNIEVYVLTEPAFTVWQNGYATGSLYESGRVTEGAVHADLPAGPAIYYLVFSNKFAPKSLKTVHATVLLRYKSWLPEWFRRMKAGFWNWFGF